MIVKVIFSKLFTALIFSVIAINAFSGDAKKTVVGASIVFIIALSVFLKFKFDMWCIRNSEQ